MGLLDKIKATPTPPRPLDLNLDLQGTLVVRWDDGPTSRFGAHWLRSRCPCAACVEEWSGKRTVGEEQTDPNVKPQGLTPIGNYAIQIRWSDGHDTGIYSWDYLFKLRLEAGARA